MRVPVDLAAVLATVTEDEALRAEQHHVRLQAAYDGTPWSPATPRSCSSCSRTW